MLKQLETTIDGVTYRITQVPWLEGMHVFRTLVGRGNDVMVGALLKMDAEKRAKLLAGDKISLIPLVAKVLGELDHADLNVVVNGLGKAIELRVGESEAWISILKLEDHFAGRYMHFVHVFYEAARHNFSGPT